MQPPPGYKLSDILATYRQRRELPGFDLVFDWLWQACRALEEMHRSGVVHGSVSPSVILIGANDQVTIERGERARPAVGANWGDFSAAPDRRADLYGLGATFYELLTLLAPTPSAPPASAINRTVPPAFDAVLGRLLETGAGAGYSSAEEVLAALEGMKRGRVSPVVATDAAPPDSTAAPAGVPRSAMIVAGIVVGAGAGAAAGHFMQLLLPAAAAVGAVVGAIIGIFANPKV
jgi:hypothetical protein